jgi:glutamate synthase (ferredoxin)
VQAVVEGVGDHGCEYMTGGRVVILGSIGRNFAAGMSGGVAYVLDEEKQFVNKCNIEMVLLERLEDEEEIAELKGIIEKHVGYTDSPLGQRVLNEWSTLLPKFVKVIPKDYKRMMESINRFKRTGVSDEEATMAAFQANMRELARVGGN